MTRQERARGFHAQGLNCAQGVLLSLQDYTGLDTEVARQVACGFGGGVRCGEICGCVSGGVMALGTRASQAETADLTRELVAAFRAEHGCVRCAELLEKYGGKGNCDNMIASTSELAAQILEAHTFSPLE